MSEETTPVQSAAPPEVQREAEAMGWIPPSRFNGDPERFIDADLYIKRGQEVLPIIRAQNTKLANELAATRAESRQTASALKQAQDAIAQMEERHTVATQKAVEDARRQVKAQLAAASEAGDHLGVAELTDQLLQLKTAEAEAKKAPAPAAAPPVPEFAPPSRFGRVECRKPLVWYQQAQDCTCLGSGGRAS